MRHLAIAVAALTIVLAPARSQAVFHVSRISELMSGLNGDPTVQFVEVRMQFIAQNFVMNGFLTAFSCDGTSHSVLLQVPHNLTNQGAGVHWLMATTTFAAATGITPDFTWDPAVTGNIDPTCGMVCWGGTGVFMPTMPDAAVPDNYVDCVGYGGYTGPTKTSTHDSTPMSGTPTALHAGDGTQSLTRTGDTGNNTADFALAAPTPTNNSAGAATTTTTVVGSTTTLPGGSTTTTVRCADVAGCATQLASALPSPSSAQSKKAKKVAVKLGKLDTQIEKALTRAASATGKKQQKAFTKAKNLLNMLLAKARAADAKGTLPGSLASIESAVMALLALIP